MEQELNWMKPGKFAILHLYWGGLMYFFFVVRLFTRLRLLGSAEPLSTAASRRVLLALVVVCIVVGFLMTCRRWRNNWSLALNVLRPYGIYLAVEAMYQAPVYLWVAGLFCAGLIGLYAVVLFSAPIRRRRWAFTLGMRFYQLISAAHLLLSGALCLLMVISMGTAMLGVSVIRPTETRSVVRAEGMLNTAEEWREQLQGLRQEQWTGLTLQERVDLMKVAVDIEVDHLGLPDKLQISCLNMPPDVLGSYDHQARTVNISRDHLLYDPPEECLDTALHEVYHSYQHHLCALYEDTDDAYRSLLFLQAVRIYIDEFENYTSGYSEDDYLEYYTQFCEMDAREYTSRRLVVYQYLLSST